MNCGIIRQYRQSNTTKSVFNSQYKANKKQSYLLFIEFKIFLNFQRLFLFLSSSVATCMISTLRLSLYIVSRKGYSFGWPTETLKLNGIIYVLVLDCVALRSHITIRVLLQSVLHRGRVQPSPKSRMTVS